MMDYAEDLRDLDTESYEREMAEICGDEYDAWLDLVSLEDELSKGLPETVVDFGSSYCEAMGY